MGLFHCIVNYYTSPEKHLNLKLIEFLSIECMYLLGYGGDDGDGDGGGVPL